MLELGLGLGLDEQDRREKLFAMFVTKGCYRCFVIYWFHVFVYVVFKEYLLVQPTIRPSDGDQLVQELKRSMEETLRKKLLAVQVPVMIIVIVIIIVIIIIRIIILHFPDYALYNIIAKLKYLKVIFDFWKDFVIFFCLSY